MQETVQEQKLNGAQPPINDKRVITCYKKKGRKITLKRYGLTDSQLYGLLHRNGVPLRTATGYPRQGSHTPHGKARRKANAPSRRGSKGPENARRRALYKARRDARAGGAIDALTYLEKARGKAIRALGAGLPGDPAGPILGLIELAIESLRGEE